MNNSASASRRTWNRVMNALVWASAVLVIVLVAGILGMVLVRGIPHISWKFLTTTASVLKGTDGILPAILNTLYVILLTLLIVLPLGVGAGKWHIIRTIVLPCSIDGIVTGCILAVGRIVGESAALLFTAGAAEVIANGVIKAYTSNGATLSVLLYLRAFEDGDFDSAWAIGAVLLVLVLAINLAARLAKTKLKQKQ